MLKSMRLRHHLTQEQLANLLSMPVSTYRGYESGRRAVPVKTLAMLADLYGTTITYLAGLTDCPEPLPISPRYIPPGRNALPSGRDGGADGEDDPG